MSPLSPSQQSFVFEALLSTVSTLVFSFFLPLISNIFTSDKKNLKDIFKGRWWPNWVFIFLVFALSFFILLSINLSGEKTPVLSADTQYKPNSQPPSDKNVVWKRLADNQSDWDLTNMNISSDNIYCPRIYNNNFIYRSIWFRQQVPVVFSKIQLRFSVKQPDNDQSPSKAVIQLGKVYGKDYNVGNFYLPFDKTQGVNFESYNSAKNSLVFQDNPGSLPLLIKPGSVVTTTVSTTNILSNTITYQFHIEYIPASYENSIPSDFQYFVTLPDSSPSQLLTNFGLGVFANSCLKDVEYSIDD